MGINWPSNVNRTIICPLFVGKLRLTYFLRISVKVGALKIVSLTSRFSVNSHVHNFGLISNKAYIH